MVKYRYKYKILLAIFFIVLITSLWPNNIYLLVLFSLLTYVILPIRKFWDNSAFFLLLFSLFYSTMVIMTKQISSGFVLISCLIAPVGFYRLGRWMMVVFYEDKVRQKLFLLVITCYLSSLFVMTIKDISLVGIVNLSRVMLGDLNNTDTLAATIYGLMTSVGIGCISVLFSKEHNWGLRLWCFAISILSVLVVIHLVNRTGIVIFICCILASAILSTQMSFSKIIPVLILISVVAVLITKTGIINEEILDAYLQREMNSTSNAAELGGRSAIWGDALSKLVTHPFGWPRVHHAHNLWLDIARVGGWISFFLFMIPSIIWVKQCFRLSRKKITPFILLLLSINIATFLSSFVEPVIDASMLFFSLFMMIWGCTASISKE